MKHAKILITLLVLFLVSMSVKAKDYTDYCQDAPAGTKESCSNTVTFCYGDKEYVGCPFDQKKKVYSTSASNNDGTEGYFVPGSLSFPFDIINIDSDIPLERSYVALDNRNRVGFVGCYKGQILKKQDPQGDEFSKDLYYLVKSCSGSNCIGTAYFFKIIVANEKTCNPSSDGIGLYFATDAQIGGLFTIDQYNEYINMSIGKDNWTPRSNGNCPIYLNFNPNVNSFMDSINRYRLSDDQRIDYDMSLYSAVSNFFVSQYNQNNALTGCTTEDTVGVEEMRQCFETKAETIKKFNCPNDKSGYDKLKTDFDKYQKECKDKYDELYSRNLITESSEKYLKIINDAIIQVVDECYESKCGVDPAKVREYTKGTTCENGCVESAKDQSDSPSASCWMSTGGSDPFYKWMESSDVSKYSTCHPESSISKDDCYGKVSEKSCYTCLKEAYSKAGLTETQITCIEEGEAVKKKIIKDIEESSNEHDEEQIDQNAQNTNYFFHIPGLEGFGFGTAKKCSEIFGENLGVKIIKGIINALRIVGAIIAIANAMITLIPAVISKDAEGLKKAGRKLVMMAVVLAIIGILPSIVNLIGLMFGYDLSCIF